MIICPVCHSRPVTNSDYNMCDACYAERHRDNYDDDDKSIWESICDFFSSIGDFFSDLFSGIGDGFGGGDGGCDGGGGDGGGD